MSERYIKRRMMVLSASNMDEVESECASFETIASRIDALGVLSGIDQCLKGPITSMEKLRLSDHMLYVCHDGTDEDESVFGYVKIGYKSLFFYNDKGIVKEMQHVPVCLDFFVAPDKQRCGIGKALFDEMLQDQKKEAYEFAYDRPSRKLTPFLMKNYNLANQNLQPNRFAIYPSEGFPL